MLYLAFPYHYKLLNQKCIYCMFWCCSTLMAPTTNGCLRCINLSSTRKTFYFITLCLLHILSQIHTLHTSTLYQCNHKSNPRLVDTKFQWFTGSNLLPQYVTDLCTSNICISKLTDISKQSISFAFYNTKFDRSTDNCTF